MIINEDKINNLLNEVFSSKDQNLKSAWAQAMDVNESSVDDAFGNMSQITEEHFISYVEDCEAFADSFGQLMEDKEDPITEEEVDYFVSELDVIDEYCDSLEEGLLKSFVRSKIKDVKAKVGGMVTDYKAGRSAKKQAKAAGSRASAGAMTSQAGGKFAKGGVAHSARVKKKLGAKAEKMGSAADKAESGAKKASGSARASTVAQKGRKVAAAEEKSVKKVGKFGFEKKAAGRGGIRGALAARRKARGGGPTFASKGDAPKVPSKENENPKQRGAVAEWILKDHLKNR